MKKKFIILSLATLIISLALVMSFLAFSQEDEYTYASSDGIRMVQEEVMQWILQNQPENAWQKESILRQIELWFPHGLPYGYALYRIGSAFVLPYYDYFIYCCDHLLDDTIFTDDDVILTGGLPLPLTEDELQSALERFQQINPYVIGLTEIMLDDGTFIYAPIYCDDYNPIVFSGPMSDLLPWAIQNQIDISCEFAIYWTSWAIENQIDVDWELVSSWAIQNQIEINLEFITPEMYFDFEYSLFELLPPGTSLYSKYIVLYDGTTIFFGLFFSTNTCPSCQGGQRCGERLGWTPWVSVSNLQHFRTCRCCGLGQLQLHSIRYAPIDDNQHRAVCDACDFRRSPVAHSWGWWNPAGRHQCIRNCRICGWAMLQGHSLLVSAYGPNFTTFRCIDCEYRFTVFH